MTLAFWVSRQKDGIEVSQKATGLPTFAQDCQAACQDAPFIGELLQKQNQVVFAFARQRSAHRGRRPPPPAPRKHYPITEQHCL